MAEIYLARALGIEGFRKIVVLKRIIPNLATDDEFVKMFLDEARIAATLRHANIAQVHDLGEADGNFFFTMEYVHGEDMRAIMEKVNERGRPPTVGHGVAIVAAVAAGLHHAHEKVGPTGQPLHIVHRDVSPSNVILSYDGTVKLVDFGVAKAVAKQAVTRMGRIKGKYPYMSPEQCRGEALDRRSDCFALGILLYEFTTGRRLFNAAREVDIMRRVTEAPIDPPSRLVPDISPELDRIVLRALERPRERRYQTAQELEYDLEELARKERLVTSPVTLARWLREQFGGKPEPELEGPAPDGTDHFTLPRTPVPSPGPASAVSIAVDLEESTPPAVEDATSVELPPVFGRTTAASGDALEAIPELSGVEIVEQVTPRWGLVLVIAAVLVAVGLVLTVVAS
jgi:serine/threonine protein kinase